VVVEVEARLVEAVADIEPILFADFIGQDALDG
jgi:hypothetical protein